MILIVLTVDTKGNIALKKFGKMNSADPLTSDCIHFDVLRDYVH